MVVGDHFRNPSTTQFFKSQAVSNNFMNCTERDGRKTVMDFSHLNTAVFSNQFIHRVDELFIFFYTFLYIPPNGKYYPFGGQYLPIKGFKFTFDGWSTLVLASATCTMHQASCAAPQVYTEYFLTQLFPMVRLILGATVTTPSSQLMGPGPWGGDLRNMSGGGFWYPHHFVPFRFWGWCSRVSIVTSSVDKVCVCIRV